MTMTAVIGGTGINQWPQLEVVRKLDIDTPYGAPSAPVTEGRVGKHTVLFLARHGEGHRLPPHRINYRANLWALREAGANQIIAIAAVGGISPWFTPGTLALPEDFIDYTYGREHTYSDGLEGSTLAHIELSDPYSPDIRRQLRAAASQGDITIVGNGVMGVTQGPRLETPAEVRRMQQDGCDMVGMTSMPEAALAAELKIPYACVAVSVNWAAGIGAGGIHAEIEQSIERGMAQVGGLLAAYFDATDRP